MQKTIALWARWAVRDLFGKTAYTNWTVTELGATKKVMKTLTDNLHSKYKVQDKMKIHELRLLQALDENK